MRWGIALVWAVVISALYSIPVQDLAIVHLEDLFKLDKFFYLVVFAIGAWLLVHALKHQNFKYAFRYTFIAYAFFGLLLEFLQAVCFEERHADFFDWLADVLGIFLALLIYQKIYPNEPIKS